MTTKKGPPYSTGTLYFKLDELRTFPAAMWDIIHDMKKAADLPMQEDYKILFDTFRHLRKQIEKDYP